MTEHARPPDAEAHDAEITDLTEHRRRGGFRARSSAASAAAGRGWSRSAGERRDGRGEVNTDVADTPGPGGIPDAMSTTRSRW